MAIGPTEGWIQRGVVNENVEGGERFDLLMPNARVTEEEWFDLIDAWERHNFTVDRWGEEPERPEPPSFPGMGVRRIQDQLSGDFVSFFYELDREDQ